ncbi:MAG TPA: aminotransferase class IV [Isosphaeraceae bacterium]|jgi:D-alanine transaminase
MPTLACLNGEIMPVEEARVPVWDRGYMFGDAVYEVFRLFNGRPWLEAEHVARLRRSLAELELPPVDLDRLMARVWKTIAESGVREGTAYIQISRGVAPRAHAFPDPPVPPTELVIIKEYDDAATALSRETGVPVISGPDLRWGRCDVKSTNLLGNVLALEHAKRAGAHEAILVGRDGLVTEATHSSVLWVRNGRLEGTPDGPEILPGTKRHFVQSLAPDARVAFAEARVTLDELKAADEVMLLGTTIEVLPVISIDGDRVGDGTPWPVARRLQTAYWAAVERWLSEIGP